MSQKAWEALGQSLEEFGDIDALIVRSHNGYYQIIDGSHRFRWAKERGVKELPCDVVEVSDTQAKRLTQILNRTRGEDDPAKLKELLDSLVSEIGVDEAINGMLISSADELDDLLEDLQGQIDERLGFGSGDGLDLEDREYANEEEIQDVEAKTDKADELREKWGVERGQIWQLGDHRLMCGDSTDGEDVQRLMDGAIAGYGLHDPPYGIQVVGSKNFGTVGGSKAFGSDKGSNIVKANNYYPIENDDKPFDPSFLLSFCGENILWGANYYADKLPITKGWLVWDKKGKEWKDNFSDAELAWTSFDSVTRIYRYLWMGIVQEGEREIRQHPTQKPSGLYRKLITDYFEDVDKIIVDFYLGSGTTLVACEQLNRKCRAMEISPGYVAVAIQRWVELTGKDPILL